MHNDDQSLADVIKEIDQSNRIMNQVNGAVAPAQAVERRTKHTVVLEERRRPRNIFKLPPHLISDSAKAIAESPPVTDPYMYYVELGQWLRMKDPRIETMCVMLLNSQNQKLGIEFVAQGTANGIHVHPRQVFDIALDPKYRATGIILAHNHPSGNPAPSPEDVENLRSIAAVGRVIECRLKDFIVVGAIDFYSHKNSTLEL